MFTEMEVWNWRASGFPCELSLNFTYTITSHLQSKTPSSICNSQTSALHLAESKQIALVFTSCYLSVNKLYSCSTLFFIHEATSLAPVTSSPKLLPWEASGRSISPWQAFGGNGAWLCTELFHKHYWRTVPSPKAQICFSGILNPTLFPFEVLFLPVIKTGTIV